MIIFSSETRKTHPQASLISDHIWDEFFNGYLSEWQIKLMQESILSVKELNVPRNNNTKFRDWICLTLSHEEVEPSILIAFAKKLGINDIDLLYLASSLGHVPVVSLLLSQHSSEVKTVYIAGRNYACFINACAYGHIDVFNLLFYSVDPLRIQEMLASGDKTRKIKSYAGFILACSHNQTAIVKKLLEVVEISKRSNMLSADNFAGLRAVIFENNIELDLLLKYPECLAFVAKKVIRTDENNSVYVPHFQRVIKQIVKSLKQGEQCLALSEELWYLIIKCVIQLHYTNLIHDLPFILNNSLIKAYITSPEIFEELYNLALATDNVHLILLVLVATNHLDQLITQLAEHMGIPILTLQDKAKRISWILENNRARNPHEFFLENDCASVSVDQQSLLSVKFKSNFK